MGIQLKNGGENSKNSSFRNQSNTVAAKQELSQKQEEMRQKALAFEEMEARKNPQMAAEREQRLAQMRKEEEQRAQFKAEEEAKIKAERRVQEKKMDQTEALIAAIRAQVEKEKAAKEEANKQVEAKSSSANKSSSNNGEKKQQFRTISPEEMAKLEEKKRLKATGGGDTAISGGLGEGPTLSNPNGNGPTLSNPNAGQESLTGTGIQGGGLGIDITAGVQKPESGAEESTVALSTDAINAAMEKSKSAAESHKPHTPSQVVGGASTIVVDDGSAAWTQGDASAQQADAAWVESGAAAPQQVSPAGKAPTAKAENDFISVVPVRQKPVDGNDVQSAYNIDFDDGDDDDDVMSFGSYSQAGDAQKAAEEEARRKAEEEAARKAAEEEARRKAEEEAKRKAEEEAARKAAEEEARRKAEEEAKRKAEEEAARKAAEEEARRKAEEEARRKAEEEAARKAAEEEARRKAEEEIRRKVEEEARRKAEEEIRRKVEEEAKQKAEEEIRRRIEEEARKKAEAEASAQAAPTGDYSLPVGAEQFLGKYLSVGSISEQIVNTMRYISDNPSEPRNVVVLGQYGFGTTTIAEDFARSFYTMGICKTKTIAKIKAAALNRANISDAISKLQGGCLVVENAGVISPQKLEEIYQIVSSPDNDVVVIMTGQIETLSKLFKDNAVISSQFKHLIQVHRITDMDVFSIAKNHAIQLGYPCEPGAESNLRRRMQEVESGNLDRVLKIVDNAVSKAHNREMGSGEQEHRLVAGDFE